MDTMNAVPSVRPSVSSHRSSTNISLLVAPPRNRSLLTGRRAAFLLGIKGVLLAGLLGCSPAPQAPESLEAKDRECREVVSRILKIQAERDRRSDDLNRMIDEVERWEAGQSEAPPALSPREQKAMIREWREQENRLRNEVSGLYIASERSGCL